jgi:ribulose-phosphate 3-epimerase
MSVRVAPSLLSADFARMEEQIRLVEEAGADLLHLDVMDAHFVPNLTFGPLIVEAVRRLTRLPLDVHLMITDPDVYVDRFIEAGADRIDFHQEPFTPEETAERTENVLERLEAAGVERALAVNPETDMARIHPWLDRLDAVLVMTVHPGFGGQSLIPGCVEKIPALSQEVARRALSIEIGVDGGVTPENAPSVAAAGAGMLVAGSAVYKADDPAAALLAIRSAG